MCLAVGIEQGIIDAINAHGNPRARRGQPLLLEGSSLYSMFKDFDPQDYHWVLPVYRYKESAQLLATLAEKVIAPAEGKVKALHERRRLMEEELTKKVLRAGKD